MSGNVSRLPTAATPGDELVDSLGAMLPLVDGRQAEFDERDLAILDLARAARNDIADLEALLLEQGLTVAGSTGQSRLNPVVAELRLQRGTLARMLADLRLPDESGQVQKSVRHQRAARARWSRG